MLPEYYLNIEPVNKENVTRPMPSINTRDGENTYFNNNNNNNNNNNSLYFEKISRHGTRVSLHDYRLFKYEYSDLLYLQICLSNIKTYIKTYVHTNKLIRNN